MKTILVITIMLIYSTCLMPQIVDPWSPSFGHNTSGWNSIINMDTKRNQRTIRLALEANETKNSINKSYLYIRLDGINDKAEVEILWEEQTMISYDKNKTITIRYDKKKPVNAKTINSGNDTSSLLENPKTIIKNLMEANKFTAKAKLNNNSTIERTFDLDNLADIIEPYRNEFGL